MPVRLVLLTAISLGLAGRLLRSLFAVPPPLTIDWTPAVYGVAGFFCSAVALQVSLHDRRILPPTGKRLLVAVNGLCFTTYLVWVASAFWQALAHEPT